jgi:Domain of unknown function (DUF4112)
MQGMISPLGLPLMPFFLQPSDQSKGDTPCMDPVVLKPARWARGAWIFRDQTLQRLEFLLDEAFRLPGTPIRFGWDGVIGLVPVLGDVIAGLLSMIIPLAAWIRGVPYVTIVRMAINIAIGVLAGSVPLLGDAFDIVWKANRRNYLLLKRHLGKPHHHTWRDWTFLLIVACALGLVFIIPMVLVVWLLSWFFRH